jgi:hypothetical protein
VAPGVLLFYSSETVRRLSSPLYPDPERSRRLDWLAGEGPDKAIRAKLEMIFPAVVFCPHASSMAAASTSSSMSSVARMSFILASHVTNLRRTTGIDRKSHAGFLSYNSCNLHA